MITIEYCEETGIALSDGAVEGYIQGRLDTAKDGDHMKFANILAMNQVRWLIVQGNLDVEIQFLFKGKYMVLNEYGNVQPLPENLPDRHCDLACKTLKRQSELRRKLRKVLRPAKVGKVSRAAAIAAVKAVAAKKRG